MTLDGPEAAPESWSDPRDAVTALFHAHHRSLLRLAVLLVDDAESAEEVVQDAFVGLYRNWSRVREPGAALQYLRVSTVNLSRSRLRRRRTERSFQLSAAVALPSAETEIVDRSTNRHLVEAVAQLPRRQREVVVLRFFLDLTEAQIADFLGVSRGSVKQHASRAMSALAERLEAWA